MDDVRRAITNGYNNPTAKNPSLWSSTMWEAFTIGQYLRANGKRPEGFRKSRSSSFTNGTVTLKIEYGKAGSSTILQFNAASTSAPTRPGDAAAIMQAETGLPFADCLVLTNTD